MTPEQQRQFEEMKRQIAELLAWKQQKQLQQLTYPLDEASRNVISRI